MPSLEESRKQVKESLSRQAQELDHDDILAGLQDEIDKHNAIKGDARETMRKSKRGRVDDHEQRSDRPFKFRFKDGGDLPQKRKRRSHRSGSRRHRAVTDEGAAHPFPREPLDPTDHGTQSADTAFRTSLLDALADDEGAGYWEGVYAQPIHVYDRPVTTNPHGELEMMSDEDYAAYVKTKMWERKHPEIVLERDRSRREERAAEMERAKRREDFLRRKERAAWERAEKKGAKRHARASDSESDAEERSEGNSSADVPRKKDARTEYDRAWEHYLAAWDRLKLELLDERSTPATGPQLPSKRIPWPVLESKAVIRANIEAFMQHAPANEEKTKVQSLKAERVRWHPDKIQQRFASAVDHGTMKLVTGVFQVVDALFEGEKKKPPGR
ncbi:hypothetical protein LTR53_014750 [Teratosphaeriaceae sp. CCFEE 6253]|nr:hypothetical protein LTR53_014750 [Teratosphaeriaceae sp. CCFEE 6253]